MIAAPALVAWLETVAPDIRDRAGYPSRVPHALAVTIAARSLASQIFPAASGETPADADRRMLVTAGTLLVFAFLESSYQRAVVGDHGIACGTWQHHAVTASGAFDVALCERLRSDWSFAADIAIADLRRSALGWPEHPWALYAGGRSAAAAAISDARAALVARLISDHPVSP